MRFNTVNINQIKKSSTFLVQYHLDIEPINTRYQNLLSKQMKNSIKVPFNKLTNRVQNREIEKGDIIIKNYPDGRLLFELAKKAGKEKPYWIKYRVIDNRVSPEYLLWFFSKKEILEYLSLHATGSVIRMIPSKVVEGILIPIPKVISDRSKKSKVSFTNNNGLIRQIIQNFYLDYQENLNMNRFETAIILAGAICEAILYESLLEVGIKEKILSQNKTLGHLIEYAQIKELDKTLGINLTHFENIKQQRNKTIHIGSAIKRLENGEIIEKQIFKEFDNIIKHFGI
jgi:hypothetical protein